MRRLRKVVMKKEKTWLVSRDRESEYHPVSQQHNTLSRLKMEEYQKAITFLQDIIRLFHGIKTGRKGSWNPVQTGIIMATSSILAIEEEMLTRGHRSSGPLVKLLKCADDTATMGHILNISTFHET
ncbi:hypothetical protein AOLI_G00084560 [Acnodon oligacanthus]